MPGFSPAQRETATDLTQAPSFARAGPLARQALIESGIVESGLRDAPPSEGNLDSQGVLQQRASQGWGTVAQERNPTAAAELFLQHAIPLERQFKDAGSLAQAVQRSAFPERYGQHAGEAAQLLRGIVGAGSAGGAASRATFTPGGPLGTSTSVSGGVDPQALAELVADVKAMSGPAIAAAGAHAELPVYGQPASARAPMRAEGIVKPAGGAEAQQQLLGLIEQALGGRQVSSRVTQATPPSVGYAPAGSPAHAGGPLGGLLPANAMLKLGRIDEGQDGQTNPGSPIIANGSGYVKEVKSDPGGFGPRYPVVVFTSGPLAKFKGGVYLGHTLSALARGAKFTAGQVLSHTGTSGVGNATVPGWFEVGLAETLGQGDRGQGALIAPSLR